MKCIIIGGYGFLGWHLACRLRATLGIEPVRLGRDDLSEPECTRRVLSGADVIFNLAGVNRAESAEAVEDGNVRAAQQLTDALRDLTHTVRVVNANSTQCILDNPYGRGKARAAELLRAAVESSGGTFVDVILPNLFGEHGRPHYNSFVATFCYLIATGGEPQVSQDREVSLLHAQRAAQVLIEATDPASDSVLRPQGHLALVSDVLDAVRTLHTTYSRGDLPDLTDEFATDLFNTYRSFVFPKSFPRYAEVYADARGGLFETSRTHGGTSQTFVSTTRPGRTRGNHYHLHKVERFFVVSGEAEIAMRRLLSDDDAVRFRLSGERPSYVDMPTLWVHNITNVGEGDLVTMFWSDQLLDPNRPDQFPEAVETTKSSSE